MNILRKILPWLGAAATGNVPALASLAVTTIGNALGKKLSADNLSEVEQAIIGASPEQIAALQKEEHDFQARMSELGIKEHTEIETIFAADRANARAREMSVRDWMPKVLGLGIVSAFISAVMLVLTGHGRADSVLAGTLIGYLSAKAELVASYYFGSSAGSDRKTEILATSQGGGK